MVTTDGSPTQEQHTLGKITSSPSPVLRRSLKRLRRLVQYQSNVTLSRSLRACVLVCLRACVLICVLSVKLSCAQSLYQSTPGFGSLHFGSSSNSHRYLCFGCILPFTRSHTFRREDRLRPLSLSLRPLSSARLGSARSIGSSWTHSRQLAGGGGDQ